MLLKLYLGVTYVCWRLSMQGTYRVVPFLTPSVLGWALLATSHAAPLDAWRTVRAEAAACVHDARTALVQVIIEAKVCGAVHHAVVLWPLPCSYPLVGLLVDRQR